MLYMNYDVLIGDVIIRFYRISHYFYIHVIGGLSGNLSIYKSFIACSISCHFFIQVLLSLNTYRSMS
jgi:hypothetical protein